MVMQWLGTWIGYPATISAVSRWDRPAAIRTTLACAPVRRTRCATRRHSPTHGWRCGEAATDLWGRVPARTELSKLMDVELSVDTRVQALVGRAATRI